MFVHPVTVHVKERFLDLLGWRCIDVLLSILSFQGQPYDSCQVQVCFHPFLRAHKFLRWRNLDIIAQVTELWRGVFRIIWKKKKKDMFNFVIFDIDLALNRYCLWSWDHSAHTIRYAIVFFEKSFCNYLVLLLVNMQYLYKYWDSIGWWKFMDIIIYKIAENIQ